MLKPGGTPPAAAEEAQATAADKEQGVIMLILTRRVGERLMIGDEISVTVLGVKGNQVRIGVHAPTVSCVSRVATSYSSSSTRDTGN